MICLLTGTTAMSSNLSPQDVVKALEVLTVEKTERLIFHLGVSLNVLDDIETQYKGDRYKMHAIQEWLNRDTAASWDKIISKLQEIGMSVVAERVQSFSNTGSIHVPVTINSTLSWGARVAEVKATIGLLEERFAYLMSDTRAAISEQEKQDGTFLDTFRDHLMGLPVTQKPTHTKYFDEKMEKIYEALDTRKLFLILGRYCSYYNYEILHDLIQRFCDRALKGRMISYREKIESFEKTTTIDVYTDAISAPKNLLLEFSQMTLKIDKCSSECMLYEIRRVKEEIADKSSIYWYNVYVERIVKSSVVVVVRFPSSAAGWVIGAMTPDFMHTHHLIEVVMDGKYLTVIEEDKRYLVWLLILAIHYVVGMDKSIDSYPKVGGS